jgi:phosphoenolpyruvate-protein phosphotransferase (PTS system enzyme I)
MRSWSGLPASPGIAIGVAFLWQRPDVVIDRTPIRDRDVEGEIVRLHAALESACSELSEMQSGLQASASRDTAGILEAQLAMLRDPSLVELAEAKISEDHLPSPAALHDAAEFYAAQLAALEDEYLRARAIDVRDAARRAVMSLLGIRGPSATELPRRAVIFAEELPPSEAAMLARAGAFAFITASGGLTSHTAILARENGVPAIVGVGNELLDQVVAGDTVVVDGGTGILVLSPDDATLAEWRAMEFRWRNAAKLAKASAHLPAVTRDGRRIEVVANVGDAETARLALEFGAEGVGLLRTEFLFLNRQHMPDEEEQHAAYRAIAGVMGQRPVVVRTLDAGGDKPPSYIEFGNEANPFLGWRAIRISLAEPEMFKAQLRAILRAGAGHNLKVMFPMIASVGEVRMARQFLAEARAELAAKGLSLAGTVEVGIMVEIPSAAVTADLMAPEVDFFSLGTNDLTQYTLAVDRGNPRVAAIFDAMHPSVLRLIKMVVDSGHAAGKWVGMCGEMAADPVAIPLLVGLGLDELSMNPPAIPGAKKLIRGLDSREMAELAASALQFADPDEIRALVRSRVPELWDQ